MVGIFYEYLLFEADQQQNPSRVENVIIYGATIQRIEAVSDPYT